MALHAQAVALERVGDDDRRPGVVDGGEGLAQRRRVVPTEVAHRPDEVVVVEVGDQRGDVRPARAVPREQLAHLGRGAAEEPLVLGVGHVVDPPAQRGAAGAGEQLLQHPAVLHGEHLPAGGGEHPLQPGRAHRGDDAVQRLPVEIDDPDYLAQLGDHRVEHRLPDGALVELRVAHERPLAAGAAAGQLGVDVAAGQGAPHRSGRADADRAGGVVRRHRVLGPAGVALQPAELPQRGQRGRVELAEQVLQRVQHRRGVRLDRGAVVGTELLQPQRGHDGDHRGAGRLVATDLHPAGVGPHPVGVVDDRRGQPEHPVLDGPEDLVPVAVLVGGGDRECHRCSC
jgi:hypothetical protein